MIIIGFSIYIQYLINIKMQESNIDYRVKDANKYLGKRGQNNKQISKIYEKSKQFQFESEENQFQFEITFKNPAIISKVEFDVKLVSHVSISMYYQDVLVHSFKQILPEDRIEVFTRKQIKFQEKTQPYDRAVVTLYNYVKPRPSFIKYFLFKGFKEDSSHKKAPHLNLSQKDTFEPYSRKKTVDQKQQQKKVFSNRDKAKTRPTPPQILIQEVSYYPASSKENHEQAEMRKAIEESKKQHQKENEMSKKKQKQKRKISEERILINQDKDDNNQFFQYDVVEWEKVKKVYQHVNSDWMQAQRAIEREREIQQRHSVADKIKVKCFAKLSFCINNIPNSEKVKLIDYIKQLGGKVIDQPTNHCYVVTNKMEGGKINIAKQLDHIKFVSPNYVLSCWRVGAKLEQKQFKP